MGAEQKRRELFRYAKTHKPQIVLFQETYSTVNCETVWSNEWGNRIYFSHGTSNSRGVATLFGRNFAGSIKGYWTDKQGRFLAVNCLINDKSILIVNVYAPNEDEIEFFVSLFEFLESDSVEFEEVVIGGDFNTTLNLARDKRSSSHFDHHKRKREILLQFMDSQNLLDIWRVFHPDTFQFTFKRLEPQVTMSRIDFFLISQGLRTYVNNCRIIPRYITDHCMLELVVNLEDNPRGPGYWKFNNLQLADKDFVELINKTIDDYEVRVQASGVVHTPDIKWEGLKALLTSEIKRFSIQKAKGKSKLMELLQHKLLKLDTKLTQVTDKEEQKKITRDIKKTEEFLFFEYESVTQSAIFRSKAEYYALGEKPTKYFFNLEKSRSRAKALNLLKTQEGMDITDPKEILSEIQKYYAKLYQSRPHLFDKEKYNIDGMPKLSQDLKDALDLPLTLKEMGEALRSMPSNKCPGRDGFTVEFYKKFWDKLGLLYFQAITYALGKGILHTSARQGLLSLLPKKDKDSRYLNNARPITLMNIDYKILSKTLALRLKEVMPFIIHEDQVGFMAGRDISLNGRKVLDIIQYVNSNNIAALIITIDYAQAFDSLEHDAIWGALELFNFGQTFIGFIKTLFADGFANVINNGWFTNFIYPSRSTKQGCSISPFLYNICAELIATVLRKNSKIKGITINEMEYKLSQFADDMTLFLLFEKESLVEVVKALDAFQEASGLQVNYNKTAIYRIGSLQDSNAKLYTGKPFVWKNDPITILGIQISNIMSELQYLNFVPVFEKMFNVCKLWSRRNLTLSGKVLVINNLMSSLFIHKLAVLDSIDEMYVKEYENLVRRFLWGSGKPKIALDTLYNARQFGGLSLFNLRQKDNAIKTQWVAKCKKFPQIFNLAKTFLPDPEVWQCRVSPKDVMKTGLLSKFWKDVWINWAKFTYKTTYSKGELLQSRIKWNSSIKINNAMIMQKECETLRINFVGDLVASTGKEWKSGLELQQMAENNHNRFFALQALISACPAIWKKYLSGETQIQNMKMNYNFHSIPYKLTRIVYEDLVFKEKSHGKLAQKWSIRLGDNVDIQEIDEAFLRIKELATNIKLRDFQFRFLHRRILTNKTLYEWKIVTSDRCTFCTVEYETIEHLFLECTVVKRFWTQFYCWYEGMTDTEINVSPKDLVLNQVFHKIDILDTLILIAKQYIYRCRCQDRHPNFYILKDEFFYICKIERRMAVIYDTRRKFQKKWSLFLK